MAGAKHISTAKSLTKGPVNAVKAPGDAQTLAGSSCPPKIPTEIWAKVFHACVHSISQDSWTTSGVSLLPYNPLIIAHVCRYWRDITFNDPSFWATIHLRISRSNTIHETQIMLLQEWLSRAKELPISLALDEGVEKSGNGQTSGIPPHIIYDFIKQNHIRWKNLDILFLPVTDRHHILALGDFPHLQSLTLRATEIGRCRYPPPRINITTPNLTQIRLVGRVQVSGMSNQDASATPYARTRKAVFSEHHIMDFMKSFSEYGQDINAAVEEIEYTNVYELPTHPASYEHPSISLTHLTKFTGKFGAVQNCAWLLSHMDCFSIQALDITVCEGSPPLEEIGAFITRNGDQLQILKLTVVDVLEEDILGFLSECRSLNELHLTIKEGRSHSFISNRTLEGLTPALIVKEGDRCILPSLSIFSYHGHTKNLSLNCVSQLITSRSKKRTSSAAGVDSFSLISRNEFTDENPISVVESLRRVISEGQVELYIQVLGRLIVSSKDIRVGL